MYYKIPSSKTYLLVERLFKLAGFKKTVNNDWNGYWGRFKTYHLDKDKKRRELNSEFSPF